MDYSDRGIDVVRGSNRRYFSIHLSLVSSVMLDQEVPLSDAQCIIVKFLIDEGVKTVWNFDSTACTVWGCDIVT